MAVIRVNKTTDYTVMSNFHLKDKRLNLKAKGLLSVILSLPNDWNYTIGGLVAICLESESAVKSALNDLKKYGYLRVDKIKPNKENGGRYEYIYNIFEQPCESEVIEKQEKEIQGVEKQPLENQPIENNPLYKDTNKSNTNNKINNNKNTDNGEEQKRKRFVPPTLEEVKAYCLERKNNVNAERFIDYYTSNGWYVGKTKMKDWKAAVRTWENNQKNYKQQSNQNEEWHNADAEAWRDAIQQF